MAILTIKGELLSAGVAFSVDPATGTFLAPRIGPHQVTGEVDFRGNGVRNAVLESPDIRQVVEARTKDTSRFCKQGRQVHRRFSRSHDRPRKIRCQVRRAYASELLVCSAY